MSYTPTEWSTGDTITAALLNKMENGIAAGGGGGGYDAELFDDGDGTLTIVSGSYAGLAAILDDGGVPRLRVTSANSYHQTWVSELVAVTYYAPLYTIPSITFAVMVYNFTDGVFEKWFIVWDSNDEPYWD